MPMPTVFYQRHFLFHHIFFFCFLHNSCNLFTTAELFFSVPDNRAQSAVNLVRCVVDIRFQLQNSIFVWTVLWTRLLYSIFYWIHYIDMINVPILLCIEHKANSNTAANQTIKRKRECVLRDEDEKLAERSLKTQRRLSL